MDRRALRLLPAPTRPDPAGRKRHAAVLHPARCTRHQGDPETGLARRTPADRPGVPGPASPYWASKGFLGLLLPAEHPVWQDTEEPLPAEQSDRPRAIPAVNWLVQSSRSDGIVRLHNHGSDGMDPTATTAPDPHYARLAYSTRTAPTTDPLEPGAMPDNQLTLISPDGEPAGPGLIHPLGVHADGDVGHAASWYQPRLRAEDDVALPVPGTRVETHTLAFGLYEVRLYAVTAPPGWGLRASGYSLADACPGPLATGRRWTAAHRPDGLVSAISALHSFQCTGLHTRSERDAFGSSPTVPYLTGHHPGGTRIYAAAVVLSGPRSTHSGPSRWRSSSTTSTRKSGCRTESRTGGPYWPSPTRPEPSSGTTRRTGRSPRPGSRKKHITFETSRSRWDVTSSALTDPAPLPTSSRSSS